MRNLLTKVTELHESAMTRVSVDTMVFSGDINEAFNAFNLMIAEEMNEASAEAWFSNQLLLETSITDPQKFEQLQEGIFGNFIEGVKKFFKSIVSFVKGIIEKIKVQIVSQTGSIQQWEKVVLPKVDKNLTDSKVKDNFTYTGYDWKGLTNIDKLGDKTDSDALVTAIDTFKTFIGAEKELFTKSVNAKKDWEKEFADFSPAERKAKKTAVLSAAGLTSISEDLSVDRAKDKVKDLVMGSYDNKKSIEDYLKKEVEAIKSTEKIEIFRFNKGATPAAMIDFIKASKDKLEGISDSYDVIKDKYEKVLSVLEDIDTDVESSDMKNTDNRAFVLGVVSDVKEVIELKKHEISLRQSCFNAVINKKRALVQEATKEFMVVLGQFANARAPKAAN